MDGPISDGADVEDLTESVGSCETAMNKDDGGDDEKVEEGEEVESGPSRKRQCRCHIRVVRDWPKGCGPMYRPKQP